MPYNWEEKLAKIWNKLVFVGTRFHKANSTEIRSIAYINACSTVGALICLVYAAYYYILGNYVSATASLIAVPTILLAWIANYFFLNRLSYILLTTATAAAIYFNCEIIGLEALNWIFFLSTFAGSFIVYGSAPRIYFLYSCAVQATGLILVLSFPNITGLYVPPTDLVLKFSKFSSPIVTLVILSFLIQYYTRLTKSYEVKLEIALEQVILESAERSRAQREKEAALSRFESIFSAIPDLVIFTDSERKVITTNAAVERILGIRTNEIEGSTLENYYADVRQFEIKGKLRFHADAPASISTYQVEYKRNNGEVFAGETTAVPVHAMTGEFLGYLKLIRDLTEKKNLERKLEEEHQKAIYASRMASLGEMAGGVAHEINNPVAIVKGYAEEIEEILKSSSESKIQEAIEAANTIKNTSVRIEKIVRGLRAFSRDAKNDAFTYVKVSELFEDVLALCKEKFRNHGIDLSVKIDPEDLSLFCISIPIGQVILNLLNNSYDAIENTPNAWVRLEAKRLPSNYVEISVTDSGPGISKEIQEKIMQPFFTTKAVGKGTGLGLSISKGIVDTHKGSLIVDQTCKNTRFCVILPKEQA